MRKRRRGRGGEGTEGRALGLQFEGTQSTKLEASPATAEEAWFLTTLW